MFESLTAQIDAHTASPVIVAISGFGGSGKSTVANSLRDHYSIDDAQVIRIDHLYGPNPDGPDIFDQTDWPLLTQILKAARAGQRLQYVGKGYRGEAIPVDQPLPKVVIIEGVRLLQPDLMHLFDISVWIDCSQDVAMERAMARDRAQGEDEATVLLWKTDWGPKDRLYYDTINPDWLANVLF